MNLARKKSEIENDRNLYALSHRKLIKKVMQHTEEAGKAYDEELKITTAKGNERWVRVIGKAQYDNTNKLIGVRGVYQDIHAKKLKEIELETTREELYRSNKTKDRLLSIIAHDLRAPLNNIKSLIELKTTDVISYDEFNNYLDDIKESIGQVSEAMENMLQWAFTQKDGFKVNRAKVDLNRTSKMASDLYKNLLEDKKISLINNSSAQHFANADPNHVFLVLRNLINNAIKFTPEKGTITINTKHVKSTVRISISDTGVGMTQEQLNNLRENFSLQTTQGTNGEHGTGMGLSFCFEIAEKGGGSIEVSSTYGKGSTFTLILPAWEAGGDTKKISGSNTYATP